MIDKGLGTPKRMYERVRGRLSDLTGVRENWSFIVQQYSRRSLTRETDRFPALSGLTKAVEDRGLGRFVAGLWTENLPRCLAWICSKGGVRTDVYVAPSWSWASIAGGHPIAYRMLHEEFDNSLNYLEILDVTFELAGPNPTGAIRSGYLVVRGRAVLAKLWLSRTGNVARLQRGEWESEVTLDISRRHSEPKHTLDFQEVYCLLILHL